MPDHNPRQDVPGSTAGSDRFDGSFDRLPPREHDLGIVEWLQCSQQLSSETTGYLCDALLQWSLIGESWPEPVAPCGGADCDHLDELTRLHERWLRRAMAEPVSRRLELARVGRALGVAIRCERDPQGLAESQWREMVHLQPTLAAPPPPYVLPDGRVL